MTGLAELIRDGLWLAVAVGAPLLGAAVGAAVVGGMLAQWLGLQDSALGLVLRVVAVVATLIGTGAAMSDELVAFTRTTWELLPALGRGVR